MIKSRKHLAGRIVAAVKRLRNNQEDSTVIEDSCGGRFTVVRNVEKDIESFLVKFSGIPKNPLESASRLIFLIALVHMASVEPALSIKAIEIAASRITAPNANASMFNKIEVKKNALFTLTAKIVSFNPVSNDFEVLVDGQAGGVDVAESATKFHLPLGIIFPKDYVETHGTEQVDEILKAYGKPAIRVSSLGYKLDADGNEQPIALFWIDPDAEYLKGHFLKSIVLRLVELGEIGAQAALLWLIACGYIESVRKLGFYRVWANLLNVDPSNQIGIRPGDTLEINLFEGKRSIEPYQGKDSNGKDLSPYYLIVSGECPISLNGEKISVSGGTSWLMARKGKQQG